MPDPRPRAERPLPERLALGDASRLLGVDPDTLRRWADEGRVPAFTTPGGHRRFERRALERLIAARRTGPSGGLAGLGATSDRLSAAYRRRYGEHHGTPDPRLVVPESERESYRDIGRRLVDALIRHIDEAGPGRALAERDAVDLAAQMGERLADHGVALADAVSMFVAARHPFLAELGVVARRRGVEAARIGAVYDMSTGLLDRLLLAFVAAHDVASRDPATAGRSSGESPAGAGGSPGGEPSAGAEQTGSAGPHDARAEAGGAAVTGGFGDPAPDDRPALGDDGAPDLDHATGRDARATRSTGVG